MLVVVYIERKRFSRFLVSLAGAQLCWFFISEICIDLYKLWGCWRVRLSDWREFVSGANASKTEEHKFLL